MRLKELNHGPLSYSQESWNSEEADTLISSNEPLLALNFHPWPPRQLGSYCEVVL